MPAGIILLWRFFSMKCILTILTFCSIVSLCSADTVTYRSGDFDPFLSGVYVSAQDTMIMMQGGDGTGNFGARGDMEIGSFIGVSGSPRRDLLRFNITSLAGKFSSIDSVTLRMYLNWNEPTSNYLLYLNKLSEANADWIEGIHGSGTAGLGEVCWNNRKYSSINWAGSAGASTAGVDYVGGTVAVRSLTGDELQYSAIDFNFTDVSFIDDWAAGNNPGLIARAQYENIGRTSFFTREFQLGDYAPELIINFTPIPEPSSFALFGVGMLCLLGCFWRRKR
jgi:hypothetical protein